MTQKEIDQLAQDYILNEFDEDEDEYIKSCGYNGFVVALETVQSTMYSEEEVIQLLIKFNQEIKEVDDVRDWFEQNKKK